MQFTRPMTIQANTPPRHRPAAEAAESGPAVVEPVSRAVFLLDGQGIISSWSSAAQNLYGYSASEIIGRSVDLCYAPESRADGLPARQLRQSHAGGRSQEKSLHVRKDGSFFRCEMTVTAMIDAQGAILGHAVVAGTPPREAAFPNKHVEELLRGEERFRLLVEAVQEYAIFMLDPNGIVTTWNSGAERIKGYKADEIIGRHFSIFRTPEEASSGVCERELALAARDGKVEDEGWRVRKDGTKFWANVALTTIRDRDGSLLGFAKVTRDLTQRQLLDDERLQRARAEEAVRLRDEFLLVASHELRTPLTSLRLDLYGMQQDLARNPGNLAKKLERASRNSDRLATLIDSLLDVSRLSHGKLVLRPAPLDLGQLVSQSVEGMRSQAAKVGCDVSISVPGPVLGLWDRLRIEQVCTNLLSNAIKYGAGAPIEVAVSSDDHAASFQVSDRGPGIPPADLQRIFDRFERASSTRHHGGLGLGLYVSREIIRAHAGSIEASNREGGGAIFTVRLPMPTTGDGPSTVSS